MDSLDPLRAYEDDPSTDRVHHPYTAYNQGWDACEAGHRVEQGPYASGTREATWWLHGWLAAQSDPESDDDGPEDRPPVHPPPIPRAWPSRLVSSGHVS